MRGRIIVGGLVLLVLVVALAACQAASTPTPAPAPTPAPDLAAIQAAWESGPHNNAYDLYKGPNTYCAVCHSPRNWDPKAKVGKAPNCFSCKFPTDKAVRISPDAPLIPEDKWAKIGCDTCHPSGNGPEFAIWNNGTAKYDKVVTTTQLCEKCHVDSLGGTRHKIRLGGGAHSNQIGTTKYRPELCTDCHDQHSGKTSCTQAGCHTDVLNPEKKIQGHDADHANVTCVACHDASGMDIGLDEATKLWTTGETATSRGTTTFTPAYSHDFKKASDCARCHFAKNPWNLWVPTPTPAPPTAVPKPAATPTK